MLLALVVSAGGPVTVSAVTAGQMLWSRAYSAGSGGALPIPGKLAVDPAGGAYALVGNAERTKAYIVKYGPAGARKWVAALGWAGDVSVDAGAIVADRTGNVYVTGYTYRGPAVGDAFFTAKYGPLGAFKWVRRYNTASDAILWAQAGALAVDGSGNVFVTGSGGIRFDKSDYITIKYGPNGGRLWARRYNGPGSGDDRATAIGVDGVGNVYVTGTSLDNATGGAYATVKYGASGEQRWVRRYRSVGSRWASATGLAVGADGAVHVTGRSGLDDTPNKLDYLTIKYGPAGATRWTRRYNSPADNWDSPTDIAVDNVGNVYVTGESYGRSDLDYATIKYGPAGAPLWLRRYSSGHGPDLPTALSVTALGDVVVTGEGARVDGAGIEFATLKYGSRGHVKWVRRYPASSTSAYATDVAVDASGSAYVTGPTFGPNFGYATLKYAP